MVDGAPAFSAPGSHLSLPDELSQYSDDEFEKDEKGEYKLTIKEDSQKFKESIDQLIFDLDQLNIFVITNMHFIQNPKKYVDLNLEERLHDDKLRNFLEEVANILSENVATQF